MRSPSALAAIGAVAAFTSLSAFSAAQAATLLSEGFENVVGLGASGWVQTNLSNPVGLSWGPGFCRAIRSPGRSGRFICRGELRERCLRQRRCHRQTG